MTAKATTTAAAAAVNPNVSHLLTSLYTSCGVDSMMMMSLGVGAYRPTLSARTIHTLYAISFIVYSINCAFDWWHVVVTVRDGDTVSYPLHTWLMTTMVGCVVVGTILTGLLLVLCIENAFVEHRLSMTPDRTGIAIIADACIDWIVGFNAFRVSFLIAALHDTPMTLINFILIASCRSPSPLVAIAPMLASTLTTMASACWRCVMIYYSYRHFFVKPSTGTQRFDTSAVVVIKPRLPPPTLCEHIRRAVIVHDTSTLHVYDECWPIRYSIHHINRRYNTVSTCDDSTIIDSDHHDWSMRKCAFGMLCSLFAFVIYIGMCALCCAPCIGHYYCHRRISLQRRSRFARTCVRYCSSAMQRIIFVLSLAIALSLIALNALLLTSTQLVGTHSLPPEIDRICVHIDAVNRRLHPMVLPASLTTATATIDQRTRLICKPMWELSATSPRFGFSRRPPGAWELRTSIGAHRLLIVTTLFEMTNHTLYFDYAIRSIVRRRSDHPEHHRLCGHDGWTADVSQPQLPFPYFFGCEAAIRVVVDRPLIDCSDIRVGDDDDGGIREIYVEK